MCCTGQDRCRKCVLTDKIEESYVLPYVRNSYPTLVISPQAHPVFFFNIGCIGSHVISLSQRCQNVLFEMANAAIVVFLYVNSMKIKLPRIKACKKKIPSCMLGMDRQICPTGHSLASLGEPRDAKL